MKITQKNYEAFFLDFVEGRLDNSSTLELMVFLNKHPELKDELESFKEIKVSPSAEMFHDKTLLKKFDFSSSVTQRNFEDYCIAYHEKVLNSKESEKLFSFLEEYPEKKREFELFGKTVLVADKNIIFEAKPFLKRKISRAIGKVILRWAAVAAGIILIISVFYKSPVSRQDVMPGKEMVVNNPSIKPKQDTEILISQNRVKENIQVKRPDLNPEVAQVKNGMVQKENMEYIEPISLASLSVKAEDTKRPDLRGGELFQEKNLKTQTGDDFKEKKKITLWDVAEFSLKGFNKLSENDINLHRETDENGKLTALAIETENGKYGFESKN